MSTTDKTTKSEISLRELIEILLRGKLIIIIITVAAILAGIGVGFFMTPVTYEAKAILLANPFNFDTALASNPDSQIIDYLTKLPSMTIETYLHQLLSDDVLNATIQKLDLRSADGKYITAGALSGSVKVSNVAGTNLITIAASSEDPDVAAEIANTMAANFIEFINTSTRSQSQIAADLIAGQLVTEESNLNEKSLALADYQKKNRNINVLRGEITSLTNQIVSYTASLNDVGKRISADTAALRTLWNAIQNTPGLNAEDFTLSIQLDDGISAANSQITLDLGTDDLSVVLLQIEISKLQSSVVENTTEKAALTAKIDEMNKTLTQNQIELTEQEYIYNALSRDLAMAASAYDAYLQKYKQAMLTVAADIGKTSIQVSSAALVPDKPVNANRLFKIVVAAVLGLIISIVVVLFVDYWKKSKLA